MFHNTFGKKAKCIFFLVKAQCLCTLWYSKTETLKKNIHTQWIVLFCLIFQFKVSTCFYIKQRSKERCIVLIKLHLSPNSSKLCFPHICKAQFRRMTPLLFNIRTRTIMLIQRKITNQRRNTKTSEHAVMPSKIPCC